MLWGFFVPISAHDYGNFEKVGSLRAELPRTDERITTSSGDIINGNAMRPPEGANLHQWLTRNEMGIYSPLVDLMANADLGSKTVLYMLDAVICAPSEGASITGDNSRWQQAPFNHVIIEISQQAPRYCAG